ncbi:hypothetical protein KUCAC02_020723, partial [Chaenocephalus aceratus]
GGEDFQGAQACWEAGGRLRKENRIGKRVTRDMMKTGEEEEGWNTEVEREEEKHMESASV